MVKTWHALAVFLDRCMYECFTILTPLSFGASFKILIQLLCCDFLTEIQTVLFQYFQSICSSFFNSVFIPSCLLHQDDTSMNIFFFIQYFQFLQCFFLLITLLCKYEIRTGNCEKTVVHQMSAIIVSSSYIRNLFTLFLILYCN